MAVPNYLADVEAAARKYPEAWACAHTGRACTEDFIRLLALELHAKDPKIGLNGKRGNPDDLSDDALNYKGEGPGHDPTDGNKPVTVIDVIAGAGGPNPQPSWQVFSTLPGPGAWVQPGPVVPPVPKPPPEPVKPPYLGDDAYNQISRVMEQDYRRAGRSGLDGNCGCWIGRTCHDIVVNGLTPSESIAKHRAEWCSALGISVS